MKNVYLLLFAVCALFSTHSRLQAQGQCCETTATHQFAMLGADKAFRNTHLEPLPMVLNSYKGDMIRFTCEDGQDGQAYLLRSTGSDKYVFVFQEWWGLNDYIKLEAEKIKETLGNVNVMAIDLYDGKVATTREEAGKLMQSTKEARIRTIIKGAVASCGPNAAIANIGWCYGGGWSLQAAIMEGKTNKACVMYYGMPETDIDKLKTLNSDVLGIFAGKDKSINAKVVGQFQNNMIKAGKKLQVKVYDADHAFANPSNPGFQKEYTEDAYKMSIRFIQKRL